MDNLVIDLLNEINIKVVNSKEIENVLIEFKTLRHPDIITKFNKKIPELKKKYNSNMLNCLHKNSLDKQKFPGVNMLRQILKCNNMRLKPYVICKGYNKKTGKKITERFYKIYNIEDDNEKNTTVNKENNIEEITK